MTNKLIVATAYAVALFFSSSQYTTIHNNPHINNTLYKIYASQQYNTLRFASQHLKLLRNYLTRSNYGGSKKNLKQTQKKTVFSWEGNGNPQL